MANNQKLVINGGRRLEGEIQVHGAKNSALPLLAATILAHGECILHNCPMLTDVDAACRILSCLGCGAAGMEAPAAGIHRTSAETKYRIISCAK